MKRLKEILCDVVLYTYGKNCNPKYYGFSIEVSDKNQKSFHGYYEWASHKITIFNTYRDDEKIIETAIHELAHHIDECNRISSNISVYDRKAHGTSFYNEYEKLLFTALNMRLFTKEHFLEVKRDTQCHNKVVKMLERYNPNYIDYKKDKCMVSVFNSFNYKDFLKNQGYQYNVNMKCWEKEVDDAEAECEKLKKLDGVEIKVGNATEFHFKGKINVFAEGNTYPYKEELKKEGFRYKEKKWVYEAVDKEDARRVMELFHNNTEITLKVDNKIWL